MTGFRVKAPILKVFDQIRKVTANDFSPELNRFLKNSLQDAMRNTPVRDVALINKNQKREYKRRLNYIPSFFEHEAAVLIFNEAGEQWMRYNGTWYRPDIWDIPDNVYEVYQGFLQERLRRDENPHDVYEFTKERSQARYLYKRSWWEIGQSAGVNVRASQSVIASHSRHNPPKTPPKGYVRRVGGKNTLSIIVYNPFLEQQSRYKLFTGKQLINSSMSVHRSKFNSDLSTKQLRLILKIIQTLLA
jgi:hypothetical protein